MCGLILQLIADAWFASELKTKSNHQYKIRLHMNAKTFLFVAAWIKPLRTLPVEQRWNVLEAVTEYATTSQMTKQLDLMETIAFAFIRNEIDRMKNYRAEARERKRGYYNALEKNECEPTKQQEETIPKDANDATDANACNEEQVNAPYYIISESESVSKSKSDKKSSTSTCVCACVRGIARPTSPISRQRRKKSVRGGP